jgi:hypothetical protein
MIIKIGNEVECEYGSGILVACTKQWAIIREPNGNEIGLYLHSNWIALKGEMEDKDQTELNEIII